MVSRHNGDSLWWQLIEMVSHRNGESSTCWVIARASVSEHYVTLKLQAKFLEYLLPANRHIGVRFPAREVSLIFSNFSNTGYRYVFCLKNVSFLLVLPQNFYAPINCFRDGGERGRPLGDWLGKIAPGTEIWQTIVSRQWENWQPIIDTDDWFFNSTILQLLLSFVVSLYLDSCYPQSVTSMIQFWYMQSTFIYK